MKAALSLHHDRWDGRGKRISRLVGLPIAAAMFLLASVLAAPAAGADPPNVWGVQVNYSSAVESLWGTSCASATDCVAVGDALTSGIAEETTDGGQVWSPGTLPSNVTILQGASCYTTSDCVAVGTEQVTLGHFFGAIVTSTDGGANWTSRTAPANNFALKGVSCTSDGTCVAVGTTGTGGTGGISTSSDGGLTWTAQTIPAGVSLLLGVSCFSDQGLHSRRSVRRGSGRAARHGGRGIQLDQCAPPFHGDRVERCIVRVRFAVRRLRAEQHRPGRGADLH